MATSYRPSKVVSSLPQALYAMAVLAPGPVPFPVATFTFPITPARLSYAPRSMTAVWDTGQPQAATFGAALLGGATGGPQGVVRRPDIFGVAPPYFTIEGTTGLGYHGADGGLLNGIQSIQALDAFISLWATLNQAQQASGSGNAAAMELYDFYLSRFWEVVPMGDYSFNQSAERPESVSYQFRFAAIRNLANPVPGLVDLLMETVTASPEVAATALLTSAGSYLSMYGFNGPS